MRLVTMAPLAGLLLSGPALAQDVATSYSTRDGRVPSVVIQCASSDGSNTAKGCPTTQSTADTNSAPFTLWPSVSPGAVPTGTRALGYTCTAATTVVLTDGNSNTLTTILPAGQFHSFLSELPASFAVTGTNSCVFTAEK